MAMYVKTHGLTCGDPLDKRIYAVWSTARARCTNPKDKRYPMYGGRGVTMCKDWRENPREFVKWAKANGYKPGLQIDRIDNDGGYTPENCRFVTSTENNRNRSYSRIKSGEQHVIRMLYLSGLNCKQIADIWGTSRQTIYCCVKFRSWN